MVRAGHVCCQHSPVQDTNVRIFWVHAMESISAQTGFTLCSYPKELLGVESEPMLTPREANVPISKSLVWLKWGKQGEGFRPEWYISTMIYGRDIPFWSETLKGAIPASLKTGVLPLSHWGCATQDKWADRSTKNTSLHWSQNESYWSTTTIKTGNTNSSSHFSLLSQILGLSVMWKFSPEFGVDVVALVVAQPHCAGAWPWPWAADVILHLHGTQPWNLPISCKQDHTDILSCFGNLYFHCSFLTLRWTW